MLNMDSDLPLSVQLPMLMMEMSEKISCHVNVFLMCHICSVCKKIHVTYLST